MKLKFSPWLAVLFISFTRSSASDPCNIFVDNVLKEMKAEKDIFQEPYEIPDGQKSFAVYDLEFGYIYGLTTLHRVENVLPLKRGNDRFIRVYLGAGEITLQSSIKRKFLNFGKSSNLDASVSFVSMELDLVPNPDGTEPIIKNFKVDEVKGLNVKVSGSGRIKDFILNAFLRAFGRFFRGLVKNAIEEKLTTFLSGQVKDYAIPMECLQEAFD